MVDSVGSLVLSTECLLIWMVLDLNTQVRAAVYSLSVYKLLVKTKNYPPVVSGRPDRLNIAGGYDSYNTIQYNIRILI
jgi:hypothetical protein